MAVVGQDDQQREGESRVHMPEGTRQQDVSQGGRRLTPNTPNLNLHMRVPLKNGCRRRTIIVNLSEADEETP